MNMPLFLSSWAPVLVWAGLIYFLSSIPHLHSGLRWDFFLRKCAHVTEYAIFAMLVMRALRRTFQAWTWNRMAATAALSVVAYACSDEFHQSFVPGRGPSVHDVLIDSVGVFVGIFFFKKVCIHE